VLKYSVIIPVYNRPDEIKEMLDSLADQNFESLEILIIEDGSTIMCKDTVEGFSDTLNIKYYYKENTGPGDSRNFGMRKASGSYFLFFDSDCVLPPNYFSKLDDYLMENQLDAFGGPDKAHTTFTIIQKAINYSMTSFFTTGGIRGGKTQINNFQPRSFNMGMKRQVFEKVGGFAEVHPGEDPDLSFRIMDAGFRTGLILNAFVYHKRRIDIKKFALQVYKFGVVRVFLNKWHPKRSSLIYYFPSLFLLGCVFLLIGALFISVALLYPLLLFIGLVFFDSIIKTKSLPVSFLAIITSFVQLYGYGFGYLKSQFKINVLGHNERKVFPNFFFKKEEN